MTYMVYFRKPWKAGGIQPMAVPMAIFAPPLKENILENLSKHEVLPNQINWAEVIIKGSIPHLCSYYRKWEVGTMIPLMNKPNAFLSLVEEELLKGIHDIQPLDWEGLWPWRYRDRVPIDTDRVPIDLTYVEKRSGEMDMQSCSLTFAFRDRRDNTASNTALEKPKEGEDGLSSKTCQWPLFILGKFFDQANVQEEIIKVSKECFSSACWFVCLL